MTQHFKKNRHSSPMSVANAEVEPRKKLVKVQPLLKIFSYRAYHWTPPFAGATRLRIDLPVHKRGLEFSHKKLFPALVMQVLIGVLLILSLWLISINQAQAFSIIRDDEVENTIKQLVTPILKSAGIPHESVNIYILNDPNINAFVFGGQNIFLNTGLINFSNTPETLLGVLAHEIGHIVGGHILAKKEQIEMLQKKLFLNMAVGFLAGALTKSTEGGMGALMGMNDADERMFLKYNRLQENEADSAAIKYLGRAGIPNDGLVELLQHFSHNQKLFSPDMDPYLSTHPVSDERINHLKSAEKKTSAGKNFLTPELRDKYARVVAKIKAWSSEDLQEVLHEYNKNDATNYYARSIVYFRLSDFNKATQEQHNALLLEPNNAYFHEQLAQFYFETGKVSDALKEYAKAHQLNLKSVSISIGYAQTLINIANNPKEAIKVLELVLSIEPLNSMAWKLLGLASKQANQPSNSTIAFAWEALLKGDLETANKLINTVAKEPNLSTKQVLKINDLKAMLKSEKENIE